MKNAKAAVIVLIGLAIAISLVMIAWWYISTH